MVSPSYPTKINQVVSKMTAATQKALQNRLSRIEIELPPGVEFGVEAAKGKSKTFAEMSPSDRIKKSNREAARLFTEMFKIIAPTTVCMFPSEDEASMARNIWGSTFSGQVLSIDAAAASKGATNLRSRRFSIEEQEAALLGSDGIYVPDGTEVLILVGPKSKDMKKVKRIHEKLGLDTLIILLNGRATVTQTIKKNKENNKDDENNDWISSEFESVFNYAPPSTSGQLVDRELLLYHEMGEKWYIAEKDKEQKTGLSGLVGSLTAGSGFKTLWEGDLRPTDIEEILKS